MTNTRSSDLKRGCDDLEEVVIASSLHDKSKSHCFYGLIHDVEVQCLLDNGAERNILSISSFEKIPPDLRPSLLPVDVRLCSVLHERVATLGKACFPLKVGNSTVPLEMIVAEVPEEVMLGMPFFNQFRAVQDYEKRELYSKATGEVIQCYSAHQKPVVASVRIARTAVVEPGEECILPGRVHYRGMMRRMAIVESSPRFSRQNQILVAKTLVDRQICDKRVPVRVFNPGTEPVELQKNAFVGCLQPVDAVMDSEEEAHVRACEADGDPLWVPKHVQHIFDDAAGQLSKSQQVKLAALLREFCDVFSTGPEDIGRTHLVQHEIVLKEGPPIKQPARRMAKAKQEDAERQIKDSCDRGLARESNSPWASPIVMARKKDGSFRLCIDYRALNERTIADAYPIPRIGETLDALSGSKFFSTLDLRSGYWQIPLSEDAKQKSAFTFQRGLWEWNVLPFGLCNGVATFQRLMDRVLHGLSWSTLLVYLDDVLVISQTVEQMLERLREVFLRLRAANLKLHPEKCRLFQREVGYLGHLVSEKGVAPNPEKIQDVLDWPKPRDVKEVRQFLGLTGYYRRFVKGYANIALPLIELTKKGVPFEWSEACELAFDKLKRLLTESPILGYPRDEGALYLDTDASNFAVGAVLSQVQDGQEKVLAYASKALSPAEQNYCTTRRELLAVVKFTTHFRQYLLGRPFVVRTDHSSLRWLVHMKDPMQGQFSRWLEILSEFNFKVEHRAGVAHGNADALSRKPCRVDCPCLVTQDGKKTADMGVQCDSVPIEHVEMVSTVTSAFVQGIASTEVELSDDEVSGPEDSLSSDEEEAPVGSGDDTPSVGPGGPSGLFGGWTVTELARAQETDAHIGPVLELKKTLDDKPSWSEYSHLSPASKAYIGQWDRLSVRDGVLLRTYVSRDTKRSWSQTVLPTSLRKEVLKQMHDSPFGGHFGAERTLAHVQSRFFWYDMKEDVTLWCKTCEACALKARPLKAPRAEMGSVRVGGPFERIAIDVMGPLQETERYNAYILVVSDYFTKWVEAYPLPNQTAPVVADIIAREWVPRYGVPGSIHSDQGTNFTSAVFTGMCTLLGIDKTRTTPFHPSSDGMVERFNATLQKVLSCTSDRCHWDWDLMIPFALMAYRATPHSSTGLTPNMMVFGRELTEPIDLVAGLPPDTTEKVSPPQYVVDLREKLEVAHDIAREALGKSVKRAKKYFDRKAHERQYKAGDKVWLYIKGRKQTRGKVKKFLPHYEGPFVVKHALDSHTYVIQKGHGKFRVVHHDDLKPFHCRTQLEARWGDTPYVPGPVVSAPPSVVPSSLDDSGSEADSESMSDAEELVHPSPDGSVGNSDPGGGSPRAPLSQRLEPGGGGPSDLSSEEFESGGGGSDPTLSGDEYSAGPEVSSKAKRPLSPVVGDNGRPKRSRKAPDRLGQWVCELVVLESTSTGPSKSVVQTGVDDGVSAETVQDGVPAVEPPEGFEDTPVAADAYAPNESWWSLRGPADQAGTDQHVYYV